MASIHGQSLTSILTTDLQFVAKARWIRQEHTLRFTEVYFNTNRHGIKINHEMDMIHTQV